MGKWGGFLPVAESGGLVGTGSAQSAGCLGPSSVSLGGPSPVVDLRVPVLSVLGGEREPCQGRSPPQCPGSHGDSQECKSGECWYVGRSADRHRPGKGGAQGQAESGSRELNQKVGWGWACFAGGGRGRCHSAPRGVSGAGRRSTGGGGRVSGAPEVSVPGRHTVATRHSRGWVPSICLLGCVCCA